MIRRNSEIVATSRLSDNVRMACQPLQSRKSALSAFFNGRRHRDFIPCRPKSPGLQL